MMDDDYASDPVFFGRIDIYKESNFTQEIIGKWESHIIESYASILKVYKDKIDNVSPIQFSLSASLLDEVLIDAVIGMSKIATNPYNAIKSPNAFKVAAYLTYWWLRHKPVYIHYPEDYSLDDVQINYDSTLTEKENELERKKMGWRLKHINEVVAVQIAMTYIFDFSKPICGKNELKHIAKVDKNCTYEDFDSMRKSLLNKLTYYFAYRAIAPKIIEQILESYTFHPAWALTGKHWSTKEDSTEDTA